MDTNCVYFTQIYYLCFNNAKYFFDDFFDGDIWC